MPEPYRSSPDRFCLLIPQFRKRRFIPLGVALLSCCLLAVLGCGSGIVMRTAGSLQIDPGTLDFGAVGVGKSRTKTVVLTNPGETDITISKISATSTAFTAAGGNQFPIIIPARKAQNISVAFVPSSVQNYSAQLEFADSTSNPMAQLPAQGKGQYEVEPVEQMATSTDRLDFGSVTVNTSVTKTISLTSTGTTALTVNSVSVSGSGFTVTGGMLPVTLQPDQSLTLTVQFDPTTTNTVSGSLAIQSTAVAGATTIALSGSGNSGGGSNGGKGDESGQGALVSQLEVSAQSVSFGEVTANTSATQTITLTSTGTAPVTVDAATITGNGFSLIAGSLPVTLNPAQSVTLQLEFNPAMVGAASGQLMISSNSSSGGTTKLSLSGTGTAVQRPHLTVSAGALGFGRVMVDTTATQSLTLISTGTAPVTVNAATISGAGFRVLGASLPAVLNPTQSVTLQVQFSPTMTGVASGQLILKSDSSAGDTTVIALSGVSTPAPSPQLTVSAGSLSFGNVMMNSAVTQTLTLSSTGTADLAVNSVTITGAGFTVVGRTPPATLSPGQMMTLQVQFLPAATGSAVGQLTIKSDSSSGDTVAVALSGRGTAAPVPQLSLNATELSFGNIAMNASATQALTLTSTGTAAVTVNAVAVTGAGFTIVGTGLPMALSPGRSMTLQVQFLPAATGSAVGQLTIKSDSSSGDTVAVALSGRGTAAPVPQLSLNATELSFGNIAMNASATQALTLTSTGTAAVTVNAAAVTGAGFTIVGAGSPVTLSPGRSMTLQVQFIPIATGAVSGQLTVSSNSNSGSTVTVALRGTGTAVPNPQLSMSSGSLAFGDVTVNAASVQSLTLTSTGTSPVTVRSAAVSGRGFSIVAGTFPVTLNPSQSLTLQVQFNPAATGVSTGQLTIVSNAMNGSTMNLVLNGSGMAANPQLTVSTTSVSFGSVSINTPTTKTLTLTSMGTTAVTVSGATVSGMGFSLVGGRFPVTLNPNQTMTLQIQFLPMENGALSGTVTIASDATRGNLTVALSGTGTGAASEVDLSWDAPATSATAVVGYNIYRAMGSSGSFGVINPAPVATVTYIDKGVTSGTTYSYIVKSVDASGAESTASNQIRLSIP